MLSEASYKPIFIISRGGVNGDPHDKRVALNREMKRSRGKPLIDISLYRKKSLSHIRQLEQRMAII